MKKDKICIFCYEPTTEYHHCVVCHNCKAVMKYSETSEKEFFEENLYFIICRKLILSKQSSK